MAKRKPSTKRPRTALREAERGLERLARDRRKLHALDDGGSPERPIELSSASQIAPRARSLRCARCDRALYVEHETARVVAARVLRTVVLSCRQCGEKRTAYFAVGTPLAN